MDDYDPYEDTSDYDHSRYMRWVHKERGTVEMIGVLNESKKPQTD